MGATAEQFKKWEQHAKSLSVESLRHTIDDCKKAEQAMATFNEEKELYYRDQFFTYYDELMRRKKITKKH